MCFREMRRLVRFVVGCKLLVIGMASYQELEVWKLGISLVKEIYKITDMFPAKEKFRLCDHYVERLFLYLLIQLREVRVNPLKILCVI